MKCPRCGSENVYVVDSRARPDWIRRRRKCADCSYRFSSIELGVHLIQQVVINGQKLGIFNVKEGEQV